MVYRESGEERGPECYLILISTLTNVRKCHYKSVILVLFVDL